MYNILLDELPHAYMGHELKTDFRQVLKFFKMQNDTDLSEEEKLNITLKQFFEKPIKRQDFVDFIAYYIKGGSEVQSEESENNEPIFFDWDIDANYIYAAFMQVYKIDLVNEHMHWWKFLALYKALPDTTKLSSIIEIRLKKPPKADKYNREYINSLMKMKKYYRIEHTQKSIGSQLQNLWGAI